MADKEKHAGHGFTHTHVEHHADGSHTIHHVHEKTEHKHGMPQHVGEHDVNLFEDHRFDAFSAKHNPQKRMPGA